MRFSLSLLTLLLFSVVSGTYPVSAGQVFSHCEQAESTADSMACVKDRYDVAQERLNMIFEQVLGTQSTDNMKNLHLTQNVWLSYRDKECRWEVDQIENESLHRIEELSCLDILTRQRADVLEQIHDQHQEQEIKEYSAFPRWVNVVAKENPQVFWRYGDFLTLDLDCDGQDEQVMVGQNLQTQGEESVDADSYVLQTVLAVAENPASGRPQTQILNIDMSAGVEGAQICDPNVQLQIIEYPEHAMEQTDEEGVEGQSENKLQCTQALGIERSRCPSSVLIWDGEAFVFLEAKE